MNYISTNMSPLEAFNRVMLFARTHGEAAVRLALHAAVPQSLRPELVHLLRLNFVPEVGNRHDIEADVLLSPLCEDLGNGYFQFDPQVRSLLLDNLATNYADEQVSRVERIAKFLISYTSQAEYTSRAHQDPIFRDYLETQNWVALAFINPEVAAYQIAQALDEADTRNDFAVRVRLSGLISAMSTPLIRYRALLKYVAGLYALETGERNTAVSLFEGVDDEDLKVGDVVLRPVPQVLELWDFRHPEASNRPGARFPSRYEFANAFLAETPYELEEERNEVRRLLQNQGYHVLPDKPLSLGLADFEKEVRNYLSRCTVSVHLVGGTFGVVPEGGEAQSLTRLQYDLAGERLSRTSDFERVVWLPEGLESGDKDQQSVIEYIVNSANSDRATILQQSTFEDFRFYVVRKMREDREGQNCG
jgi:hypothetical protein